MIRFYQLEHSEQLVPVLARMASLALERDGLRCVVLTGTEQMEQTLDQELWLVGRSGFLPHGTGEAQAEDQPVWLGHDDLRPNGADVLFLVGQAHSARYAEYQKCAVLVRPVPEDQAWACGLWQARPAGPAEWWQLQAGKWLAVSEPCSGAGEAVP